MPEDNLFQKRVKDKAQKKGISEAEAERLIREEIDARLRGEYSPFNRSSKINSPNDIESKEDAISWGQKYFAKHTTDDGEFLIINELDPNKVVRMTRTNFIHSLEHVSILILSEDNKPKKISITELWLKYPLPRTYRKIVFDPNPAHKHDPNSGICNEFRGFGTDPIEGDVAPFLEYVDLYASGDKEGANWILDWSAHLYQYPHIVPETALVARGIGGNW